MDSYRSEFPTDHSAWPQMGATNIHLPYSNHVNRILVCGSHPHCNRFRDNPVDKIGKTGRQIE